MFVYIEGDFVRCFSPTVLWGSVRGDFVQGYFVLDSLGLYTVLELRQRAVRVCPGRS